MTNEQSPSEQIARFIEAHPGEWVQLSREGTRYPVAYAALWLHNLPSVCVTIGHEGAVVHTRVGGEAGELLPTIVKAPPNADLLTKIVYRVVDSLQIHLGSIEQLPPWLVEPVRVELRRRANDLLTLSGALTTSPEFSPDSQAIEQARAVLKAASSPASLPIWQVRIAIVTDAHGVYVVISHDDQPLFTSRHVAIDRLIEAFEDAAQFVEHGMPYDDGGSALMSVRDWMAQLSVVPDLRRILGVIQ